MRRAVVLALVTLAACARGGSTEAPIDSAPPGRVDATIDGNGCAVQPCSILPQCGCNANTTCDVDVIEQDGTTCRPINLNGQEDDTCESANECDRGYVCLGGANSSCKKYCSGDADCGSPRGKCIYTVTGSSGPIPDAPSVCSSNCEPTDTTAAGCPSTMKCRFFTVDDNGTDVFVSDCAPAGTEMNGSDCTAPGGTMGIDAQCAKGYQCVRFNSETTFSCRRLCSAPGTTTGCGATQCIGFTPTITLGGSTYGVCAP